MLCESHGDGTEFRGNVSVFDFRGARTATKNCFKLLKDICSDFIDRL